MQGKSLNKVVLFELAESDRIRTLIQEWVNSFGKLCQFEST